MCPAADGGLSHNSRSISTFKLLRTLPPRNTRLSEVQKCLTEKMTVNSSLLSSTTQITNSSVVPCQIPGPCQAPGGMGRGWALALGWVHYAPCHLGNLGLTTTLL